MPTVEHQNASDGTTSVTVHYSITNSGTMPLLGNTVEMRYIAQAEGQTAESGADVTGGGISDELAPGATHWGRCDVQLDPGSWTIRVQALLVTTREVLAVSEDVTTHIAGHESTAPSFDDTQTYAVTVTITQFEHVDGQLFRVHYDLHSDRDVPAGLSVAGSISGQATSTQQYDLTAGLTAGQAHPHYLTMSADTPDQVTATITVDQGGPSETSATAEVDIAEDGTATIRS